MGIIVFLQTLLMRNGLAVWICVVGQSLLSRCNLKWKSINSS